jgi:uncharacterized protein DUF6232
VDFTHGFTHPPDDRGPQGAGRIYYRRDGIVVTDRHLATPEGRYPITELHDPRTTRGPFAPAIVISAGAAGLLLIAAIVMVGSGSFKDATTACAVVVVGIVPLAVAGTAWRLRPRAYELWAEYHGAPRLLLHTTDATQYGQICRAFIRAREATQWPPEDRWLGRTL